METYGPKCVMDLSLTNQEARDLTDTQFKKFMHYVCFVSPEGRDFRLALDFGCGTGRFLPIITPFCEKVVAYDPSRTLTEFAKEDWPDVSFHSGNPEHFFEESRKLYPKRFDFIFISLVLGGIPDKELGWMADAIDGMLSPNGCMVFAEHVSPTDPGSDFWRFRTTETYEQLFPGIVCKQVDSYATRGNTVGIFVGRKPL